LGIAGYSLGAAVLPLGYETRPFQYGHMLLHGGKGHVVAGRQLGDGRLCGHDPRQDVAPRRIGEGPEQLIQGVARRQSIYNHLVVYNSMGIQPLCRIKVTSGGCFTAHNVSGRGRRLRRRLPQKRNFTPN
jgi:hypothetical protein